MGKAGFTHIQQPGERLQVYIKKDAVTENEYKLWQLLDLGDIIGVEGYLFRTPHRRTLRSRRNPHVPFQEPDGDAREVPRPGGRRDPLPPALPRPHCQPEVQQAFQTRAKVVRSFRRQLEDRGFTEVETPMMQSLYGGAAARPFVTHHNTLDIDLYLRIAPELYLKRLIAGGMERVFEINRNFRNEGVSTRHNPEFTMLEFYQSYADYRDLMQLTGDLLKQVALDATGNTVVEYQGQSLDFGNVRRYSIREAVCEYWKGR